MADDSVAGHVNDGQLTASDGGSLSAVLGGFQGDFQISGLAGRGSETVKVEVQGALVTARKGKRRYPQIKFSRVSGVRMTDFTKLITGVASGFVSTLADIGDEDGFHLDMQAPFRTSQRSVVAYDCVLMDFESAQGDPSTVDSFTVEVLGRLDIDGQIVVAGRDPFA